MKNQNLYFTRILVHLFLFLLLIILIYLGLFTIESDNQQGDFFYIIFFHVPCAWISLLTFYISSVLSGIILYFGIVLLYPYLEYILISSILYTFLTLLTGSLWGYCTWGTFWSWDPRITTMFILFLYSIFALMLLKLNFKIQSLNFLILGGFLYPLAKYTTQLWHSIHQADSISNANISLSESIFTILIGFFLFLLLFSLINLLIYVTYNKSSTLIKTIYSILNKK